ncbi:unnamed protein product [Dibothriocephalus latus]|uniref:Uncharacterized protein n=1 Tax=Dibothriocephalus latus TaxID=60516 RepID=A0A3P7LE22_DIBLA|nr:unnamed protein product [Dibothriocephalus latus]
MPRSRSNSRHRSTSIDMLTVALSKVLPKSSSHSPEPARPPLYEVGENFSDWRVLGEPYLEHFPAEHQVSHLLGLLGQMAKRRFAYLSAKPPASLSDAWALLEQLFGPQEPLVDIHNQFCLRTQKPDELVDVYLDVLFTLGSRIFTQSEISQQVFLRFVGGLRSQEVKREFNIRHPKTLLAALRILLARSMEPPPPYSSTLALSAPYLDPQIFLVLFPPQIQLITADGSPLRCTGIHNVSIVLPNCTTIHPMLLSPDIKVDAIIGLDFLCAHQLIVDPNNPDRYYL